MTVRYRASLRCLYFVVAVSVWLSPAAARAGGRVTLCANDVEGLPGLGGLNLRDALIGGGTVTFGCKPGTTIEVTMTHPISSDTVVDGGGGVALRTNSDRAMFLVTGSLILRGLSLTNGFVGIITPRPQGIAAGPGVLGLEDCQVRRSSNAFAVDTVRIQHSVFEDNSGWVLIAARVAIIHESTFTRNDAMVIRSPLAPVPGRPTIAVVTHSTFIGNQMAIWWVGELHVSDSTFADNHNRGRLGGAIRLRGPGQVTYSTFDRNGAKQGGAIWVDDGALSLRRALFHDNIAVEDGGAVGLAAGSVVSQYGIFTGNSAARGGALKLGTQEAQPALQGAPNTFLRNRAQEGGAIYSEFGRIQLARAIFTDNRAATRGGAIVAPRQGSPVRLTLANSLVVRNTAPSGAAISGTAIALINSTVADNLGGPAILLEPLSHFSLAGARGELDLRNSVVSNNAGGSCSELPPGYVVLHDGHNLQFPGNACGAAIASADPLLDPLYVPRSGSPALQGGDTQVCAAPPISGKDIYGAGRPQGSSCAIGAVEGDIDPRLLRSGLWRVRDTLVRNFTALWAYLKN